MSRTVWVLVPGLVLFGACGSKDSLRREAVESAPVALSKHEMSMATPVRRASVETADSAYAPSAPSDPAAAGIKLIRSASMSIQVLNVERALRLVDTVAQKRRAFIADAEISQSSDKRRNARVVIRVPADRFDETLAALRVLGDVKNENIASEDVTKAYADLETRLAVSEAIVVRMRDLLAERTAKLTDVLQVEQELARQIGAIEEMKGTRRFYDKQIAMSSISVALMEPPMVVRPQVGVPIKVAVAKSIEALTVSASWAVYFVIFLAPWVLLFGAGWWILDRLGVRWPIRKVERILEAVSPGG